MATAKKAQSSPQPIVLFDGVCNLCSGAVKFIIPRDKMRRFRFAALQSPVGERLLSRYGLPTNEMNTVVLIEGERVYTKSTAALRIARQLNGAWRLAYGFIVIPRPIRDVVYDFVAANRYHWFGRKDACLWQPAGALDDVLVKMDDL